MTPSRAHSFVFRLLTFLRHLPFGLSAIRSRPRGLSYFRTQHPRANPGIVRPKSPPLSHRRGVSLVEMLIVISVATVIVGTCTTMLHLLLRTERDQTRAMRMAVTMSRLSQLFRDDVHGATRGAIVSPAGASPRLTLSLADAREIVYSAEGAFLQRVENRQGTEVHRDTFHFPAGSKGRFEEEPSPRLMRLAIDVAAPIPHQMPEGRTPLAPPRTLQIEALLNRDGRFAGRER